VEDLSASCTFKVVHDVRDVVDSHEVGARVQSRRQRREGPAEALVGGAAGEHPDEVLP